MKGNFHQTIDTNDAQEAELQAIATAIEIAEGMPSKNVTILCDCKNAVKYSNKKYITPFKYAKPAQQIYTCLSLNMFWQRLGTRTHSK